MPTTDVIEARRRPLMKSSLSPFFSPRHDNHQPPCKPARPQSGQRRSITADSFFLLVRQPIGNSAKILRRFPDWWVVETKRFHIFIDIGWFEDRNNNETQRKIERSIKTWGAPACLIKGAVPRRPFVRRRQTSCQDVRGATFPDQKPV